MIPLEIRSHGGYTDVSIGGEVLQHHSTHSRMVYIWGDFIVKIARLKNEDDYFDNGMQNLREGHLWDCVPAKYRENFVEVFEYGKVADNLGNIWTYSVSEYIKDIKLGYQIRNNLVRDLCERELNQLADKLQKEKIFLDDMHGSNWGMDTEGQVRIIDSGRATLAA